MIESRNYDLLVCNLPSGCIGESPITASIIQLVSPCFIRCACVHVVIILCVVVGSNPNWEGRVNLDDAVAKLLEAIDGSGTEPIRMSDKENMKV